MRSVYFCVLFLLAILFYACSGSDTYRGAWKATDQDGNRLEIIFDAKSFTVTDSTGKSDVYGYTQNSVKFVNSIETYGIQLKDGRRYEVHFPRADNEDVGVIRYENGPTVYTIGRNEYVRQEDVYRLD